MKRIVRIVSLVLVLSALLAVGGVMAATLDTKIPVVYGVSMSKDYVVRIYTDEGTNVINGSGKVNGEAKNRELFQNVAKIEVTFSNETDEEYAVFLVKGSLDETKIVPTDGNEIYYINQLTATGKDTVTIYPKNLTDEGHYRVYISGKNYNYVEIGRLNVAKSFADNNYLLGDVDGDGDVDILDAQAALKASVKLQSLNTDETERANVDSSTEEGAACVTILDAFNILKKSVKLSLSIEEG